jgi:phosphatidylinositol glycan class B
MLPMKRGRVALCLGTILFTATGVRLGLGFVYFGFHTGDDVAILQAGFWRALGWPYQPWEIRNLLVSDLLTSPAIALASALGASSTRTVIWLASVPMVLLASLNVWLVYRLTVRWLASEPAGVLASALYAFHWLPLGYGSMVYPRTVSTACVLVAALVLWDRRGGPAWWPFLAGGCLAVAWAVRYSEAIFLLPLFMLIGLREKDRGARLLRCGALAAGFLSVSLLTVGLEDWLTWGKPFASLVAFARYTLLERRSSSLEPMQPWYWYLWRLPKWLAPTLLPFLWRARKVPGSLPVALFILLPVIELSVIHHKQLRYLQGVVPFVVILAAAGARSLWESGWRRSAAVLAALCLLLGLGGLTFLARKSMAAVLAARQLAASPREPATICLSQAWAYGATMYLGNQVEIRDLPFPLTEEAAAGALGSCPLIALYREDYRRDARLPALLRRHGFTAAGEYHWGESRPVLLFRAEAAGTTRL